MPRDIFNHESERNNTNKEGDGSKKTSPSEMDGVELLSHPSYQELMRKLDEAEQKANQHWERILRMQADNDNAVRRAERDIANAHKYALERFVTELLPIVDSLELCVNNVPKEIQNVASSVIEGVHLTLKMFYAAMEKFGIKQINPVSEPFNSEYHQAISMQTDSSIKPGMVISVLQKGYTLNNRLIRPALVIVSKENDQ
ncbi:MAG: nucleotide exchange factor GrpE [Gammaproteobacteria bacterium RIFCSPHIGHO2_12_FULL_37_14]|nr:MAG: nucleotide exchange factor GrpE [Gammaproteobacteria bacterium RIFCSPHIGHO2_12_FULL_37_14]